jgi:hypothetical protein
MPLHFDSVKIFIREYSKELRSIAQWVRQTLQDIEQAVWTFALELQQERNVAIDLRQPELGTEVFRRIQKAYGAQRRGGVSLDQPRLGREGETREALLESIRAANSSDPLEALLLDEEHAEQRSKLIRLCADSFSQFSAYVVLLRKFDYVREDAAAYLAITTATLDCRIRRTFAWTAAQPSLFDRIISLSFDSLPQQQFRRPRLAWQRLPVMQSPLDF